MATGRELLEAQAIILQSRYNFKVISSQWNESESTWSDYIVKVAEEIKKGTYRNGQT